MATVETQTNSSLWLVPPPDSSLNKTISKLINKTIPPLFPEALPPNFVPHLTLSASTIPWPSSSPQEWLDQLNLPNLSESGLSINIGELYVGDIFFQKLIQLCNKSDGLSQLATVCRAAGTGEATEETRSWIQKNYVPHVSLMYSDLEHDEVISRLDGVKYSIREVKTATGVDCMTAIGAEIWLVPTFKNVGEWEPISRRELPNVEWKWDT